MYYGAHSRLPSGMGRSGALRMAVERWGDVAESKAPRQRRTGVAGGRVVRHVVRTSAEEEAALRVRAQRHGVSVAGLLVAAALNDDTADATLLRQQQINQLLGLQRDLAKVAVNVNQVARIANTTGQVPSTLDDVMSALRRTNDRLLDAVDRVAAS